MDKRVAIIDSGGANIQSIVFAFERLGCKTCFTRDWSKIESASHVVLPGVGAAAAAMRRLQESGLAERIRGLTQPVLGICLGMQLLFRKSAEGDVPCLNIIPADVEALPLRDGLTLPHTGWNRFEWTDAGRLSPLSKGFPLPQRFVGGEGQGEGVISSSEFAYFVHSYAAPIGPWTLASTMHGIRFSSVVGWKNFTGIQFHPERSALTGSRLLSSFLELPSEHAGGNL